MLDRERYEAGARQWMFYADTGIDALDRLRVRRDLDARYRELRLPRPARARLASPLAASVAAGIAAGVRWLQRRPETHRPLFARTLDEPALRHAIHEAAAAALPGELVEPVARTVAAVTARPPTWLPVLRRAAAVKPMASTSDAPGLAIADGWIEDVAIDAPLNHMCTLVAPRLPEADVDAVPGIADPLAPALLQALHRRTNTFLGDCVATWVERRWSSRRLSDLAFLSYFAPTTARTLGRIVRRNVFLHADFVIECDGPCDVAVDRRGRLHRYGGPAVTWRDGTTASFLDGVAVADQIALGRFNAGDILRERNVLLRRVMIDTYDREGPRFLRDAHAYTIALDTDRLGHTRRLLCVDLPGDEPYVAVEVTNSTAEPDGTHRRYLLRVPPSTRSCREAIAWTFGMSAEDYEPSAET